MKIDPYKHKERYFSWKKAVQTEGIPEISKINSNLILRYLDDMEHGINIAKGSVKGARSFIRLNTLRQKLIFFSKEFEKVYGINNITEVTENQLIRFFSDMRNGAISKRDGKPFKSAGYYAKVYKSFWHWWMKINKKEGIELQDISSDVDVIDSKPKWVYLSENDFKRLCDNALPHYKVLMVFLWDTGMRSPTELVNIKISDLYNDFKELMIREEASKTFGRRIKLMLCSDLIKSYVQEKRLGEEDYLFPIKPESVNKYLKNLSKKILGDQKSPAGKKYSELTMYDFRHCSCCYWLPRYKSESALKYRFGWKKSDKIHYYSELLGMKDTISEEDLLVDITKTDIEKKLIQSENEKEMLKERVDVLENQMKKILQLVNQNCLIVQNN